MRFIVPVLASSALAGCASINPVPFKGPNGHPAFAMECSGMGRTLEACYQKAGEVCPSGYRIVDRTSGVVGVPQYGGTARSSWCSSVSGCPS